MFWDSGKCFGILGRVLDSGTCFGILARVLDSGTCFGILGSVLDSGTCFVPTSHRMFVLVLAISLQDSTVMFLISV